MAALFSLEEREMSDVEDIPESLRREPSEPIVTKTAMSKAELELEQKARAINARMAKVEKLGAQADDHRLAAALELAAAKTICEEHKIAFAKWCEKNLSGKLSYKEAHVLAQIGSSGDPEKARLALSDHRKKGAERNKKMREARKVEAPKPAPAPSRMEVPLSDDAGALRSAFEMLSGADQEDFLKWAAEHIGATVTFAD